MRIIPDSLGAEDIRPTDEANTCHGPGRGHPCSGGTLDRLKQGALWSRQRNEREKASARRRLERLERRPRGRWPGGTDRVGIAVQRRRLVRLGEAEEFPEGFTPLEESNDCHNPAGSPAGGQFCSKAGAGEHLYGPGTRTSVDREYVDRRAHLQPRATELASLLGAQLPGWQVTANSMGAHHSVTATDPDGIHIEIRLDVGRPDQPWDRVQVSGAYGGVVSTLRWKTGGTLNVKKLAQIAKELAPQKREVLQRIAAARGR